MKESIIVRRLKEALSARKVRVDRSPEKDVEIVNLFRSFDGTFEPTLPIGLFGIQEYPHYIPGHRQISQGSEYPPHEIPKDEEYFEWMDILDSIVDSKNSFQFVEVGAGYGRWAARAHRLAELFGIGLENIFICTIEADPLHSKWLRDHMKLNQIPEYSHVHHECAVSNYEGVGEFFVRRPNSISEELEAKDWYGQALKRSGWEGAVTREVNVVKLSTILDQLPFATIDLLDFDIQGEEPIVLEEIANHLHRTKRIHIGTNSREDENFFRNFFQRHGWVKSRDYQGNGSRKTYIGEISFVDGVQTYLNPNY